MTAEDVFQSRIRRAKGFGFPDPIYVNADVLDKQKRVLYVVEIDAIHIPDPATGKTHHYTLKFSKFRKKKGLQEWEEVDALEGMGFRLKDQESINKVASYINANNALLNADITSSEYTQAILTNDKATQQLLHSIVSSNKNKEIVFEIFRDNYPELDRRVLAYRLVEARKATLVEFAKSLGDSDKGERNYWQGFLSENQWMFGLSFIVPLDEKRIDQWHTTDFLFESEDGFVDIVEIKSPAKEFWLKNSSGEYKRYRDCLQIGNELRGAITQATTYIFQLEKKFNDSEWQKRNKCETPVKPRCLVVLGRSSGWSIEEKTAFRLLNDSLHGVEVITFDHLLNRATLLLKSLENEGKPQTT